MPRKKRKAVDGTGKAVESPQHVAMNSSAPSQPSQAWHQAPGAAHQAAPSGKQEEDAKMKELRYLQEMFSKKLDPVVVHMIMMDCDYKVDAALETLFKLAEDSQPGSGEDLSFKNVYPRRDSSLDQQEAWGAALPEHESSLDQQESWGPALPVHDSNLDQQEAWGAALPESSGAVEALPNVATSRSAFGGLASNPSMMRNREHSYPPLPSRSLDVSQDVPLGVASQNLPSVNGYHSSSESVLPNPTSTNSGAPKAADILVDNSMFDFDVSSGARPKSNDNLQRSKPGQNTMPKIGSSEYFRLPLPGENVGHYDFNFADNIVSSSNMNLASVTHGQINKSNPLAGGITSAKLDPTLRAHTNQSSMMPPRKADDSSLSGGDESIDVRLEKEAQIGNLHQEHSGIKLIPGEQMVFPEMNSSNGGVLFHSDGSLDVMLDEEIETSNSGVSAVNQQHVKPIGPDLSSSNQFASEILSGREDGSVMDHDDNFAAQIEQELSLNMPNEPPQVSAERHIMTNEDDDLISEIVDSDDDLALAVEEELAGTLPKQESDPPVTLPPPSIEWQRSLTENEEWDTLMKEIDASADKIHTEPIAQSVQEFILENTPSAGVDKWFSPVSDSVDNSTKPFFPEYRLFPSLSFSDNILDISQNASNDSNDDIKVPDTITEIADGSSDNNESSSSSDLSTRQVTENRSKENTSPLPQRNTRQLPVIRAELRIAAKEFVPRPQDPPVTEAPELPTFKTPIQPISRPKMVYPSGQDTKGGAPVLSRMPFQPPSRHPTGAPQQMPFQPGFPAPGMSASGTFRLVGPNHMHPVNVGRLPHGMQPFQGRVIRPVPHMLPPGARPRMPMGPPGARPGPMPSGARPGPMPSGARPGPMPPGPSGPRPGPMPPGPSGPRAGPMPPGPSGPRAGPMPPGPSGPRAGPMPPGPQGSMHPVGFPQRPPGNQPIISGPGMQTRNHVSLPRMPGPGPQPQMMGIGSPPIRPGPGPGLQPRFVGPGSPQHRPSTPVPFRHPSAGPLHPTVSGAPVPPFSRPNSVPSPPIMHPHRPGLVGAPRWPLIQSNVVRRPSDVPEVKDQVKPLASNKKVMCLMRGCPGSGKSTVARQLQGDKGVIYSTDDYFIVNGKYRFDVQLLSKAHEWNQNRARTACETGLSPIIIDNTNTQRWEMKPYVAVALKHGYQVEFREPTTLWKNNPQQLAKKNSHGVLLENIEKMVERYEHNVTVDSIMKTKRKAKKNKIDTDTDEKNQLKEKQAKTGTFMRNNSGRSSESSIDENIPDKKAKSSTFTRNNSGRSSESSIEESLISPSVAESQTSALSGSLSLTSQFNDGKSESVLDKENTDKSLAEENSLETKADIDFAESEDDSPKKQSLPSPCKKAIIQLSIPLEIFKPKSDERKNIKEDILLTSSCQAGDEENMDKKECKEEAEKNTASSLKSNDDNLVEASIDEKDILLKSSSQDVDEEKTTKEECKESENTEDSSVKSDDDNITAAIDEDNKELDEPEEIKLPETHAEISQTIKPLDQDAEVASSIAKSQMPEKDDSSTELVDINIAASCKPPHEDSVRTEQIQETVTDQLQVNATVVESEHDVIDSDSEDSVTKKDTSSDPLDAAEIPNSPDLSSDKPLADVPNNIHPDNFSSLQKARQYAIEITKSQCAKYADAPCSNCTDKIITNFSDIIDKNRNVSAVTENNPCGISDKEQLNTPITCGDEVQETIMTYTDAEELDSCEIVLLETDPNFCDSVEEPLAKMGKTVEVDDSIFNKLISGRKEDEEVEEEDQFEDAVSDTDPCGGFKKMEMSSNSSPTNPMQDLSKSLDNEKEVTGDDHETEHTFLPVASEGARSKSNQRHSPHTPRLAAVFSTPHGIDDPQEEKVNWTFPGFTKSISNDAKQEHDTVSNTTKFVECSSQTLQEEFAILQKLESGKLSETEVCQMGFKILVGHTDAYLNYIISQITELPSNDKTDNDIPTIRKLDQSTMTEDSARGRSQSSNLLTLQSCFPNVPVGSLQGVLDDCQGDVQWATNILIDSGYTDSTPSMVVFEDCTGQQPVKEKPVGATVQETVEAKPMGADINLDMHMPETLEEKKPMDTAGINQEVIAQETVTLEVSSKENIPEDSHTFAQTTPNSTTQPQPNIQPDLNVKKQDLPVDTSPVDTGIHINIGIKESCEKDLNVEDAAQHSPRSNQNDICQDSNPSDFEDNPVAVTNLDKSLQSSMQDSDSGENSGSILLNPISNFIEDRLKTSLQSEINLQGDIQQTSTAPELVSDIIKEETESTENLVSQESNQLIDHSKDSEIFEEPISSAKGEVLASEPVEQCNNRSSDAAVCSQENDMVLNVQIAQVPTDKPAVSCSEHFIDGDKPEGVGYNSEKDSQNEGLNQVEGQADKCDSKEEITELNTMQKTIDENSEQQIPNNAIDDPTNDKETLQNDPEKISKNETQDKPCNKTTPSHLGANPRGAVGDNALTVPMELLVPSSSANHEAVFFMDMMNLPVTTMTKPDGDIDASKSSCDISRSKPVSLSKNATTSHASIEESKLPTDEPRHQVDSPALSKPSASDNIADNLSEKHQSEMANAMATTPDNEPSKLISSVESSPKSRGSSEPFSDDDIVGASRCDVLGLDDGMVLQLDTAFALQLQEMFGPVGFHLSPDGLSDKDLEVKLSPRIAKELHTLWAATLQERFDEEQQQFEQMIQADEQLARKLQQEEELILMQEQEKNKKQSQLNKKTAKDGSHPNTKQRKLRPLLVGFRPNFPMTSAVEEEDVGAQAPWWKQLGADRQREFHIQDIMDEEFARLIHEEDETSNSAPEDSEGKVHTLATKIKRKQLYQQFPTMDKSLLDDVFEKHNYEVTPTIRDIEKLMSTQTPPRDVYTEEELKRIIDKAEKESLAQMQQSDDNADSSPEYETAPSSSYQSFDNPTYHDFRAEATLHYQQRQECFQKAAAAYQRGLKDLASFYSRQGHQHTELLKAAHKRASDTILEARHAELDENVLDLHGLHVEEAVETLAQVLNDRKPQQTNTSSDIPPLNYRPSHLLIITGRGKNSRGGVARIRPAVATYLKNNNYRFTIANAGLIKVLV